jgi:hypothetical protein
MAFSQSGSPEAGGNSADFASGTLRSSEGDAIIGELGAGVEGAVAAAPFNQSRSGALPTSLVDESVELNQSVTPLSETLLETFDGLPLSQSSVSSD